MLCQCERCVGRKARPSACSKCGVSRRSGSKFQTCRREPDSCHLGSTSRQCASRVTSWGRHSAFELLFASHAYVSMLCMNSVSAVDSPYQLSAAIQASAKGSQTRPCSRNHLAVLARQGGGPALHTAKLPLLTDAEPLATASYQVYSPSLEAGGCAFRLTARPLISVVGTFGRTCIVL